MICCEGPKCRLEPGDPRHGTRNGYKNRWCRCAECRAAATEAIRQYRHTSGRSTPMAKYLEAIEHVPHGTHGAALRHYRLGTPACDACREFRSAYVADYRARRRAS